MKKLKTPTAVTTAVLTLITIFFWAGFEIYRSLTIKPAPPVPTEIINPLDPNLDTKTLDGLQQRMFLNDSDIGNNQINTQTLTPTSSPTAIPTSPIASGSATPIATSSATPQPTASPSTTPTPTKTP